MKIQRLAILLLTIFISFDAAFAAPTNKPCVICDASLAGGTECENTSEPSGCTPSKVVPDCNKTQITACKGGNNDGGNDSDPNPEQCKVWEMVDDVNGTLNPIDSPLIPYTPYKNCGTYAQAFHYACFRHGFECRSVHIRCDDGAGHAVNFIKLKTGWQALDITGGHTLSRFFVGSPIPDPDKIPQNLICRLMGKPPGCSCKVRKVSPDPLPPTTAPRGCADTTLDIIKRRKKPFQDWAAAANECRQCCSEDTRYYFGEGFPDTNPEIEKWSRECVGYCNQLLPPNSKRPPVLDSGAYYFTYVCEPFASKGATDYRKCQACRSCCESGAKAPAKYNPEKKNSCLVRCNANWSCGL